MASFSVKENNDQRGVARGSCTNCDQCDQFLAEKGTAKCGYCLCAPTQHKVDTDPARVVSFQRQSDKNNIEDLVEDDGHNNANGHASSLNDNFLQLNAEGESGKLYNNDIMYDRPRPKFTKL